MGQLTDWEIKILASVAVVLFLVIVRALVLYVIEKKTENLRYQFYLRRGSNVVVGLLSFSTIIKIWVDSNSSTATYFGLLSAGIAVALQQPLSNMVAWLLLVWQRPFEIGDRIQIGDKAGDVVDIRLFQFTLLEIGNWVAADQSTGRLVAVPNKVIFDQPLANYTKGLPFIWHEIPILFTLESDWRRAKKLLLEMMVAYRLHLDKETKDKIDRASRLHLISYTHLDPIVYTRVEASGILLTVRYLCPPRQRRKLNSAIWEEILEMVEENDQIQLAYPTQRIVHDAYVEGLDQ